MDINKLTIGEAREIANMVNSTTCTPKQGTSTKTAIPVGESVLIRGVTLYYVGHVESVTKHEVVLSSASWVGNTGRFNAALLSGTLDEVEPFPHGNVVVGRGAIMDVSRWPHALPKDVK